MRVGKPSYVSHIPSVYTSLFGPFLYFCLSEAFTWSRFLFLSIFKISPLEGPVPRHSQRSSCRQQQHLLWVPACIPADPFLIQFLANTSGKSTGRWPKSLGPCIHIGFRYDHSGREQMDWKVSISLTLQLCISNKIHILKNLSPYCDSFTPSPFLSPGTAVAMDPWRSQTKS